jgi:hypothetical protein
MEGLTTIGAVTLTGVAETSEIVALNRDGLGLGSFGPAAESHYGGFYLDSPRSVRAYRGADGATYVLVADDLAGMHHWWRLAGADAIVTTSTPITISESAAKALAKGVEMR